MLHRIQDQTQLAAKRRGLKRTPLDYLTKNLVVTCSGNFSTPAFLCTVAALGVDNVLFSVDWPYESNSAAVDFLKRQFMSSRQRVAPPRVLAAPQHLAQRSRARRSVVPP